jgi:hypothetical protein
MTAAVPSRALLAPGILMLASWALGARPAAAEEPSLEEKLLDNKYRHGDYAVYLAWHDPEDWQFDEHGSHAIAAGLKVRFRWLDWLRVEGDLSYYRRGEEPPIIVSIYKAPEFDGLLVGGMLQAVRPHGTLRPYLGAGPVFASLGNDFLVFRPEVREVDPGNPDQFALATWSEFDIGWTAAAGLELNLQRRWSPFMEYRHLFGKVHLKDGDVRIGNFAFDPEELNTLPENPQDDGFPHSRRYDWSGPFISAGLRIRF